MKISLVTYGSRGDVQPMLALALGLQKRGHEIIFCSPPENEELTKDYNCPFIALGRGIRNNPSMSSGNLKAFGKVIKEELASQIDQLPKIIKGSDLILGTGLIFGVPTVAEYLNIPYRFIAFSPASGLGTNKDPLLIKFAGFVMRSMTNASYRKTINEKRKPLGLNPIKDVLSSWIGERAIAATDAALTFIPKDVVLRATQTGYMHLNHNAKLDKKVEEFLASGSPPIYIGFGSMPITAFEKLSHILSDAMDLTKQRFIISSGWGGLKVADDRNNCLCIDEVPHDLLFPRVAAVVHHGGAGTIATAGRAGVPQIIIPLMADQFQWRAQIIKLGLGPRAPIFKMLSSKSLAKAITECLVNEQYSKTAKEVAAILKGTDGVELTLKVVEEELCRSKNFTG
jgi:vancomycin aglycone glucosyltransferase